MREEFKHLLSELKVFETNEHGAIIKFTDYEHSDYIEDVLIERFDIDYEYKIVNDEKNEYILCFANKATTEEVEKVINEINIYHEKHCELYETI